jgi:hypothetical protein
MSIKKRVLLAGFSGILATFAVASGASAHATIPSDDLTADGYGVISIRIGHGCEGLATNVVEVQIPEGFVSVKPQTKPGWTAETEMVESDPYELHGQTFTERVGIVRWSGGNLLDSQYDEFGISLKAPNTPDTTVAFPTIQYCGASATQEWIEVASEGQDPHELEKPAPTIGIVAGDSDHSADAVMDDSASMENSEDSAIDIAASQSEQDARISALESSVSDTQGSSSGSALSIAAIIASLGAVAFSVASRKRG